VLQVDNDLLGPKQSDHDYTGGFAVGSAAWGADRLWAPDRWLGGLGRDTSGGTNYRTLQFAVSLFSPPDLNSRAALAGERPYAGLWTMTGARLAVSEDENRSSYAALSIGALGLPFSESLHRAVHAITGSDSPSGYEHQISEGGEPTARIVYANRRLLAGGDAGRGTDAWVTWAASAGYLTETSVAYSARFGRRGQPWWATTTELTDYGPAPSFGIVPSGTHATLDVGARVRLRAYNALLQGQFRHSDVRYSAAELQHWTGEAWIGATVLLRSGLDIRYTIRAETPEVRRGPAARSLVWGSVQLSRAF
jgi:hypothetical protein